MASLSRYFQRPTADIDLLSPAAADTGGEAIGQGIRSLGQSIENINERDEDFWVQKSLADADSFGDQAWQSSTEAAGDGAPEFENKFVSTLDKMFDGLREKAPSGRAERALTLGLQRQKNALASRARGFEAQERTSYKVREIDRQADDLGQYSMRNPGVEPYSPQGRLTPPGTIDATARPAADGYYTSAQIDEKTGAQLTDNLSEFSSSYYSPRDFADGASMDDKSGKVQVSKRLVSALDWVTDQFGMGKLQINSGYRSPSSNLKRAGSGADGPHTHGEAVDIQVRDLPQPEKNRLYSLLKSQGFNSFGFGEGVLHAEIRPGQGKGRGGDHEWTYGNASKYSLVPVANVIEVPESQMKGRERLRPFRPDERRSNPDGSYSTEITTTIQMPDKSWANVPTLWRAEDGWVQLDPSDEDGIMDAVTRYEKAGKVFDRFMTVDAAEKAAVQRSEQGGAGAKRDWKSPNQYPFMAAVGLTSAAETGKFNMVEASASIAPDSQGTKSYGMFGLNSGGTLQTFIDSNPQLGITAAPGSDEFDQQWKGVVAKNPQKIIDAQLQFHESKVVRPAQRSLVVAGLGKLSNDPRAVAFVSDMVVQYGAGGVEKHLLAAAGSRNIAEFIESTSDSMRSSIDTDFRTALSQDPSKRAGLLNRIDNRSRDSMALGSGGGGSPITGNVPQWNGPIPDINQVPMYAERLERLDAMVDTMGGTPAQRRQVRDQMRSRIVRGWLSSVAETNPSAAMAALHSGKYDEDITMADQQAINGGAEQAWRSYEGEIRTAHKQLLTNLQTEAQTVLSDELATLSATGQSTGKLSDAHRAMLSDDDKENLGLAKFQYDIGNTISTARNDELPGILESLTPQGDGFAVEQKKYDYAQKMIETRQKKQQTDPAGYVISTSKQLSELWTGAMASGNPQNVQTAIQAMRRVQKSQGIPDAQIRSVTQTSQENNEKLLEGAENADVAFDRFVQLRTLYGGESESVFGEMERDGGRKGWSAVNELMDGGNVVLAKSLARVVHANAFKGDSQIGLRLARAGDTETARSIFEGRIRRETVKGLEPTGESEDGRKVNQILGETLGDALVDSPQVYADAIDAAKSYFARNASLGEEWDSKKLEEAIGKVTGGVLEHNSDGTKGKLIAPFAGMTQSQFDESVTLLNDADFKGAFVGFSEVDSPVTAAMVRDKMQFVSAGNGRYFLRYPDAGLARDAKGLPFEFDYNKVREDIPKRRRKAVAEQKQEQKNLELEQYPVEMSDAARRFWLGAAADGMSVKDALAIRTQNPESYADRAQPMLDNSKEFWLGDENQTVKDALKIDRKNPPSYKERSKKPEGGGW